MARQIALYGDTSRAAAVAYDIQLSGLRSINAELAELLMKRAEHLDWLDTWMPTVGLPIDLGQLDEAVEKFDYMSEYSKQAARNMQSHFADFLFDPFAKGAKGMAEGFSNALRRMAAEAAAAELFERIGSWASGYSGQGSGWINALGSMFGGGR